MKLHPESSACRDCGSRVWFLCSLVLFLLIIGHGSESCLLLPLPATSIHPEGQVHTGWAASSPSVFSLLAEWFSKCSMHQNHQQGLLKHRLPGLGPRWIRLSLGWSPRICIPNTSQVMLMVLIWGLLFENLSSSKRICCKDNYSLWCWGRR